MDKQFEVQPARILLVALFFLIVSVSSFNIYQQVESNSEELSTQRNYNFDIAIGHTAQPRQPTQFDIPVGIIQDAQGINYQVYESRTLVTNDFSKLFIGVRA